MKTAQILLTVRMASKQVLILDLPVIASVKWATAVQNWSQGHAYNGLVLYFFKLKILDAAKTSLSFLIKRANVYLFRT